MTTAVSARVRRSIRYAEFDLRNAGRQQHADVRRERMRCADSLKEFRFQNTQDWTNTMDVSPSGRFQVIEDPRPKTSLVGAGGIRWDLASAILVLIASAVLITVLVTFGVIGTTNKQIANLDRKIAAVTEKNEALTAELDRKAEDISVCSEALKLNLISAYGAKPVELTVPAGAAFMVDQTGEPPEALEKIASTGR